VWACCCGSVVAQRSCTRPMYAAVSALLLSMQADGSHVALCCMAAAELCIICILCHTCKGFAVLEKAACKAGKAGKTLPSCLPHCATQCCLAATRMHSWPTHCNAPLTVNAEQVDHSCPDPGASGAPTLLRPDVYIMHWCYRRLLLAAWSLNNMLVTCIVDAYKHVTSASAS
jgi:hypothetical protein